MASIQEPEVQFAQRLASNEKPIRTKAIKKLRKYINVRSQKDTGGFTGDEVLKLWKGLFYCLWMQDKPLLQEELSSQISSLIHSFQGVDGQFLYLESFLLTFKREWTGIDRLRMDKFFQIVRFMFRQTFEMLKRKNWDSGVVARFLELLTTQLLQSGSEAPTGLQFHILDLYMTELAAVGSAELTADQNLTFIEPFCKTAAKTKDRTLFRAICNSIFSSIIDQAPFAIEDLMKEVKAAGDSDSDSGQASEEEDDEDKTESKPVGKKGKQMNGKISNEEEEEDYDDDNEDDDELLHLEDSDTEAPCDDDAGPVLQFDYAALANRLFELASRSTTPSQNRQRLYKIIKVLRDLSEGVFPQDEYPEEVSTDEDDDMFGSRKRMKKGGRRTEEDGDDDGAPASKKRKGKKKEATTLDEQNKDSAKDDSAPADLTASNENKKKKKRKKKKKKKKAGQGGGEGGENAEKPEQEQIEAQSVVGETESVSSVKVTVAATPEGQPETVLPSEAKKQPTVTVTEEQQAPVQEEPETSSSADATVSAKKKKKGKKGPKVELQTDGIVAESQVDADEEKTPVSNEAPEADTTTPGKKKKKGLKAEKKPEEAEGEAEINGVIAEDDAPTTGPEEPTDATTPGKKKSRKNKKDLEADGAAKVEAAAEVEGEQQAEAEITSAGDEASADGTAAPQKKKTKKKGKQAEAETPLVAAASTPAKRKKKNPAAAQTDEIKDATPAQTAGSKDAELPSDETEGSSVKPAKKKKRKIPVVFEFEADEVEAAAAVNGLAEDETAVKKTKLDAGEPSTPRSAKKSQKKAKTPSGSGSDFITFQKNATVPTPLFCKTKGSPSTPKSSKKKIQTPKSESKKVTFGLKNNKTAEFRKTDRSLLVSPDGSSRVAFDPKQKPKFGVLKSPATPLATKVKKTPNGTRKASSGAPQSTPKRRPSAADFF